MKRNINTPVFLSLILFFGGNISQGFTQTNSISNLSSCLDSIYQYRFNAHDHTQKKDTFPHIVPKIKSTAQLEYQPLYELICSAQFYTKTENYDLAKTTLYQAIELAKTLQDTFELIDCYNNLNYNLFQLHEYEQVLITETKFINLCELVGDRWLLMYRLSDLFDIYMTLGRWKDAIKSLERSKIIALELGHEHGLYLYYIRMGTYYEELGSPEYALANFLKAKEFAVTQKVPRLMASVFGGIANSYLGQQKYKEAISIYQEAIQTLNNQKPAPALTDLCFHFIRKGIAYIEIGELDSAEVNLVKGMATEFLRERLKAVRGLLRISFLKKDFESLHAYGSHITQLANKPEVAEYSYLFHQSRIQYYQYIGAWDSAYWAIQQMDLPEVTINPQAFSLGVYDDVLKVLEKKRQLNSYIRIQKRLATYTDSIRYAEKEKLATSLQIQFETEQKEQKIALLSQKLVIESNQKQRNLMLLYGSILLLVLLSLVALVIYRSWRSDLRYQDLINEKRIKMDQLAASKRKLIALLSHDIRSPLASIKFWVQNLKKHHPSLPLLKDLEYVEHLIVHAEESSRDLVLAEELSDQNGLLTCQAVDIQHLIKTRYSFHQLQLKKKGLDVQYDFRESPVLVRGNEYFLIHVIDNLISNAIKYSPDQGSIRWEIREQDGHILVSILDEGKGVLQDFIPHLFAKKNHRALYPSTENSLGVGLSLVKHYLQLMNGDILYKSIKQSGACFQIRLKRA